MIFIKKQRELIKSVKVYLKETFLSLPLVDLIELTAWSILCKFEFLATITEGDNLYLLNTRCDLRLRPCSQRKLIVIENWL